MGSALKRFLLNVGKHWWGLLSCAVFTILGLFLLHKNASNAYAERADYVVAGICLLWSCFMAWHDKDKQVDEVVLAKKASEASLGARIAELEREKTDRTPLIGSVVHEALLIPDTNGADVFLDTEISNASVASPTLVTHYEVQLLIGNKKFISSRLLQDADQYESFNWGEELADPDDSYLSETTWDEKRLNDLSKEISPLHPIVHNLPRRGWLHFRLDALPSWTQIERGTGVYEWQSPMYDEDGEELSPAEEVEVTIRVPDTRSVAAVVLDLSSPGGGGSQFMASVDHSGRRRIRRIKS